MGNKTGKLPCPLAPVLSCINLTAVAHGVIEPLILQPPTTPEGSVAFPSLYHAGGHYSPLDIGVNSSRYRDRPSQNYNTEGGREAFSDCSQTLIVGQVWSVCSTCLDRSMCSDVTVSFVANMETRQKWVRLR